MREVKIKYVFIHQDTKEYHLKEFTLKEIESGKVDEYAKSLSIQYSLTDNRLLSTGLLDKNGKEIYEGDVVRYLVPYRTYQTHYGERIPTPDNTYTEPLEPEIREEVKQVVFSNGAFIVKVPDPELNYEMNLCYANKEWTIDEIKYEIDYREGNEDMEYLFETYGLADENALIKHLSGVEIIGDIYSNPNLLEAQ